MTREEQIRVEAIQYADHESEAFVGFPVQEAISAFQSGAIWADSYPNWHKFPYEKPEKEENPEWSETVLIAIHGLDIPVKAQLHFPTKNNSFEYWYTFELSCHIDKEDVLAWMELPKPPKFD